jgi:UDP-3-O-[3-hydroxymyristoyl] glucosamine N-acyltransferase
VKKITLAELAGKLGGDLDGDPEVTVSGVAPLNTAGPDQISFLANARYRSELETTLAAGVIVSRKAVASGLNLIRVDDPYLGFAMAMEILHLEPYKAAGISDNAFVHQQARIGQDPSIHPYAVVCESARLGDRVTLMPGAYVGPEVTIGDDTTIHPNVVMEKGVQVGSNVIIHAGTVVGSDGFGFAREGKRHKKIIHTGTVRIEDDVEIGVGCGIDRGVMGETVIGRGSKLDNLVHVAHNVSIGRYCLLTGQIALAGSVELGDSVVMGGQSGVSGHLKVGNGTIIFPRAGVVKDALPGARLAGFPAIDDSTWKRSSAIFNKLDELRKRVINLEKELSKIHGGNQEEDIN